MLFELSGLPVQGWVCSADEIVEVAKRAEVYGFDRFGISDHRYLHDCMTLMTACALATKGIKVATHVTDPFVRHPSLTACAIATLADLSGGRVVLGLGGGVEQPSHWVEDRSRPLTAMREAVQVMRALWRGETVNFDGKVIKCRDAKLNFPLRYPIPIMIASRSPRSLELAGEIADLVLLGSRFNGREHYMDNLSHVKRGAEKSGRSLESTEVNISVQSCVCDDSQRALDSSKPFAAVAMLWAAGRDAFAKQNYKRWEVPREFSVPRRVLDAVAGWDYVKQGRLNLPDSIGSLLTRDIVDQFAVSGTPAEVAERYREIMKYPHLSGIRIQMIPVKGGPIGDGFMKTLKGLGEVLRILKAK